MATCRQRMSQSLTWSAGCCPIWVRPPAHLIVIPPQSSLQAALLPQIALHDDHTHSKVCASPDMGHSAAGRCSGQCGGPQREMLPRPLKIATPPGTLTELFVGSSGRTIPVKLSLLSLLQLLPLKGYTVVSVSLGGHGPPVWEPLL